MHTRVRIFIDKRVHSELKPFMAFLEIYKVRVMTSTPEQLEEINRVIATVKARYPDMASLLRDRIIRAYRNFYWKIKIDPTKQRPSSKALIRRVIRTGRVPLINNIVDAGNMASLMTGISIGLYDLDKIEGEVLTLKYSQPGDRCVLIGGEKVVLKGEPCLYDQTKIIHIYPHRDCDATKITDETKNVLIIACGVPNIRLSEVIDAANKTKEYILRFAGGIPSELSKVGI